MLNNSLVKKEKKKEREIEEKKNHTYAWCISVLNILNTGKKNTQ